MKKSSYKLLIFLIISTGLSINVTLLAQDGESSEQPEVSKKSRIDRKKTKQDLKERTRLYIPGAKDNPPLEAHVLRALNKIDSSHSKRVMSDIDATDLLELFSSKLDNHLIGQKELKRTFINIRKNELIYGVGARQVPEVVYMMGLPGTGKDTAVDAFLKSMHEDESFRKAFFRMPVMRKEADLWKAFGSNQGYVGSEGLSKLIVWLVMHSAGRYEIQTKTDPSNGRETSFVIENPLWRPGDVYDGYTAPEHAVLFVDEFHNWSKDSKDGILKQATEKGYWPINNGSQPGAVGEIYVPVNILIASNEGMELVAARDANGNPVGEPMTAEEIHEKWSHVRENKSRLKKAMRDSGSNSLSREVVGGISEETANRIPNSRVILMEPHTHESIKLVANIKLKALALKYATSKGHFGPIEVRWDDSLVNFLQEYEYKAEEGARQIDAKITSLIESTINEAILESDLKPHNNESPEIVISITKNEDRTFNLECVFLQHGYEIGRQSMPILATYKNRPPSPLSSERISEIGSVPSELRKQVFGIDVISERLGDAILDQEERAQARRGDAIGESPARTFMFLGLSSTGKTETAKALNRVLGNRPEHLLTIDFSSISTINDLKTRILGGRDLNGRIAKSEFMEHYDKFGGKAIFVFDEIANAPADVLRVLYDILREPVVRTFADGVPRPMSDVMIIATGNAGEEWFKTIPRNVSKDVQQAAMHKIYTDMMNDPQAQRKFLELHFSEAFLNRVGFQNIFFFSPLHYQSLRQLSALKLRQAINRLRPSSESGYGWNIAFASEPDYITVIEMIEEDGFELREQGASIDRFVKEELEKKLRVELLKRNVEIGSQVVISYIGKGLRKDATKSGNAHNLLISTDGGNSHFTMVLEGPVVPEQQRTNPTDQITVAYHEAGHAVVRQALMSDKYVSGRISIIEGVARISGTWVHYAGIAESERYERMPLTRAEVLHEMAVLYAGEQIEILVTGKASAGKSNDIERATQLARRAILEMGVSKGWGDMARSPQVSLSEFITSLSPRDKEKFETEVRLLIQDAKLLSKRTLIANYESHIVPLSVQLAKTGEISKKDMINFFEQNPADHPSSPSYIERISHRVKNSSVWLKLQRLIYGYDVHGRQQLIEGIPTPDSVANISDILAEERRVAIEAIDLGEMPIVDSENEELLETIAYEKESQQRFIEQEKENYHAENSRGFTDNRCESYFAD